MTNLQERIVKDYKLEAKERTHAEAHRQAIEDVREMTSGTVPVRGILGGSFGDRT